MALDPHIVQLCVLFGRATVIFHIPEMTVALFLVAMILQKEILGQLEHNGEEDQQFPRNLEVDVLCEVLDLVPVLLDDGRVLAFRVLWREFGDVVALRVISDASAGFDLPRAEGLVAVVTPVLEVGAIFDLLVGWKIKDLLAQAELTVDLVLGQAEIGDVEEP
jgi:hypothetical protein